MEDFITTEYNFFLNTLMLDEMNSSTVGVVPSSDFLSPAMAPAPGDSSGQSQQQALPQGATGFMVQAANAQEILEKYYNQG